MLPSQILDRDWRLRLAAFTRLAELREANGGVDVVSSAELLEGFVFEGERVRLYDPRRGIWKPRQASVALSVVTTPAVPGRPAPYDDQLDERTGFFEYKYEGSDPHRATNRAVRDAMHEERPLIYLIGISKGQYQPVFPAYITGDSPAALSFRLEADADIRVFDPSHASVALRAPAREYATRSVKVRLHQRRFRELVVGAYRRRCAICEIRHENLLDAAHILPDRHERGVPEIPNGLSLCKIHHSAYDVDILGIDPDYRVHIRYDILRERDGPMLRWGLQEMHHRRLWLPREPAHNPNREFLGERFERFRSA